MGARFVRLTIAGFKSFADAASLEILPGLTGVVGPNGCGKSNVAEALRWAMGEANARHLRGAEMDDIIFAGTANRPARNVAEVSLTIEDDEAGMPPPFSGQTELQVARRIDRGTGSAYRVNGREARARDVQTLFADLASGARSSAMVSQGRVGALVNARPEERRAVLEEAAGITGLHARRAEAETRLRATESNLQRAEEHRAVLMRHVEGLRGQAKQAARYRVVVTSLQETEAALWATLRARAQASKESAASAVVDARLALDRAQAIACAAQQEADSHGVVLPDLRSAETGAIAAVERARMALEGANADLSRAQTALAAAEARQAQLSHDLAYAEATLNEAATIDSRLVAEAERLGRECADHPALLLAAQQEADAAAAALVETDMVAHEAASAAAVASAQREAAQQSLLTAEARNRRSTEALTRLTTECTRAQALLVDAGELAETAARLSDAEAKVVEAAANLAKASRDCDEATRAARIARDDFREQDTALHRLNAEVAALAEVLSIKDGEKWPPMIDSLSVPVGLEAALGGALGEELAAAADPTAARHWRALPACVPAPLPVAPLRDHVSGPPLLARALDAIGLVETDEAGAAAQANLAPGQCVVSRSGAVWRWDGYTVRAGTPTTAAVRLQQRNRLARTRTQRDQAAGTAAAARATFDTAQHLEREATASLARCRQVQDAAQTTLGRARTAAAALRTQAETAAARLTALNAQRTELMPEAEAAQAAAEAARNAYVLLIDPAALKAAADRARLAVAAARQRDLAAARAVDVVRQTEAGHRNRIKAIARERDDRRMRVIDLEGRVTDLRARAVSAKLELERLVSVPEQIRLDTEKAKEQLAKAEAVKAGCALDRQAAETLASTLALQARASEQESYAARETLLRAENALLSSEQALAAIAAQLAERESTLPPLPGTADLSEHAEERARARMSRLVRERDEIGPVNLRADIEASAVDEEIATIIRERDALETAISKLRGSIGHLNREGRERLTAVFQAVDRNFQALFSKLFGGGRAHLAMVGSDDPLLAGLEIFAQPPGKKLSALSLLSGGEQALTALSLIFAVFRCNPAPLCILDEVDAPLDDANVGRFCGLLGDMVAETGTRFLVVTHHQVTMAAMDRLYGVTMQERGVSRLLSVDLARAVDLVEAVAAE